MSQTEYTHIRRCHVCGATTEIKNGKVCKCDGCGKYLAPFCYFDESKFSGVLETGAEIVEVSNQEFWKPLRGLTAIW